MPEKDWGENLGQGSEHYREQRTLREVLRYGEQYLAQHGIEDASVDAWLLLEYVTGLSRAQYLVRAAEPVETVFAAAGSSNVRASFRESDPQEKETAAEEMKYLREKEDAAEKAKSAEERLRQYRELLKRRGEHIPLQHLTGEQEFMGLPFLVNEHVLIPRQDTETLVEEALARLKPGMRVLDLCTGSGCIAVSLAKLGAGSESAKESLAKPGAGSEGAKESLAKPGAGSEGAKESLAVPEPGDGLESQVKPEPGIRVDASDISPEALAVARENARRLGAQVRLIRSDLFEKITDTYGMIVSNPPYIRTAVIEELAEEVRLHEPRLALDGSWDGLHFYREIVRKSAGHLVPGGWLMLEIGHDQAKAVRGFLEEAGYGEVAVIRDLAGHDRVVCGRYPGNE